MPTDFIDGWGTVAGNGSPAAQSGCAIHLYAANRDMGDRYFYSADGELLVVPQQGRLHIATEMGVIDVTPAGLVLREIAAGTKLDAVKAATGANLIVSEKLGTFD